MGGDAVTSPKPRTPLNQMGQGNEPPKQIAGQPAAVCPYCGAGMFVDGVNKTNHEIIRYIQCRNKGCGKRFMSKQPPAKLIREVGTDEDDSAHGKPALTLVRESA